MESLKFKDDEFYIMLSGALKSRLTSPDSKIVVRSGQAVPKVKFEDRFQSSIEN